MSKVTKTEATKQKQHTQHRIIVNFHPLPFRTIVVCMGVRTLHLSCHLAPVFAPCLFLRTSSFLRTHVHNSLVRAVCYMSKSTMTAPAKRLVIEEKKMFVGFPHIRRPVLHESDHDTIWEESGRQVHARTREHQG